MEDRTLEEPSAKKGVAIKLFGVVLVFLGILDSMLSWRGGFAVSESYALLVVAGVFLYLVGVIRSGNRT